LGLGIGFKAGALEFLEVAEGGAVGAVERVDAVLEAGEGLLDHWIDLAVRVLLGQLGLLFHLEHLVIPDLAFDAGQAAEHPLGAGEGIDECALFGDGGLVAVVVFAKEDLDSGGILAEDEEGIGIDAGFQGIPGGARLALNGAGAGGILGIEAVGLELPERRHSDR